MNKSKTSRAKTSGKSKTSSRSRVTARPSPVAQSVVIDGRRIGISASDQKAIDRMKIGNAEDLRERVGDLDVPVEEKNRLLELWERMVEIGGKAIDIGKRVLATILWVAERMPHTSMMAVIAAVVAYLASCIPLLHILLAPLVALFAAVAIAVGVILDIHAMLKKKLALR